MFFFYYFLLEKNIIFGILKGIKCIKLYFFPENLKKFYVSAVNLGRVRLPKHRYFSFGLML